MRMFVNDTYLLERDFLLAPFCPSSSPSSPATSFSSSELSSMDMNRSQTLVIISCIMLNAARSFCLFISFDILCLCRGETAVSLKNLGIRLLEKKIVLINRCLEKPANVIFSHPFVCSTRG